MVDYSVNGSVALLLVNNPPVNALSHAVRKGLADGMLKAEKDRNVKAIVIAGKGRTFPAGADIREFSRPKREPWLTSVGNNIESSRKPVVAAIHGTCLGGGLEVALFCHYRVALKSAKVGFPEVALGILPGAAGTQRLPRVTGLPIAFDMITSGRHVSADQAKKYGIIDEVFTGDIVNSGIKYALSMVGKSTIPRRLRAVQVPGGENVQEYADAAMAQVKKKYKGYQAPVYCVRAIKASVEKPYDLGVKNEETLFKVLGQSGQARAQQYAFFAERLVGKWQMPGGNSETAKPLPVRSTAVIGAGTMGSGIAVCILSAGLPCYLVEQNEKFLNNGVKTIKALMEGSVKLGKISVEVGQRAASLLKPTMSYDDLTGVDLVIEAVYENLDLKKEIFAKLDKICKPSTILCSNTSSLDIDRIAVATNRPEKCVGVHFFAPAYHMKLLENIYSTRTSPVTAATVMKLGKTIGKVPVLVKSCQGFLANRMNTPYGTEATFLVEEGALPWEVDQVMEDFGMPMGPFKVRDLSGLDINVKITEEIAKTFGIKLTDETRFVGGNRYSHLNATLVNMGRLGRKSGKGWYKYEKAGGKLATVDDEVISVLERHCRRLGMERRTVSSQEIIERLLYPCINEGFKILEEGIAKRPEDIDISWLYGFTFPKYLGGPMYYASQVGLDRIYDRICHYHEAFPYSKHWVPSLLLRRLSEQNIPLSQWMASPGAKL
ncbi:peroxisomal bifunctional enzyme-like [Ylistrum balloti]|uniref:peroxisomal bifunctional enzyme-like n=1 Tax=Ylistrum balloti TaxID=509963 RepID=UPI00290597E7|nr:peroxisomal bifunctional enzyme-like [Ylistrum balloti]